MWSHEIEAATSADLSALVGLAVKFYEEDNFATPEHRLSANLRILIEDSSARVAVLRGHDGPVAFAITTTTFGLEDGLIAELQDLYVLPEHRGRGLSSRLVEDSDAWARQFGATLLEVVVAPNGLDVSHLERYYAHLGFADEGRKIWTRPLTPPS